MADFEVLSVQIPVMELFSTSATFICSSSFRHDKRSILWVWAYRTAQTCLRLHDLTCGTRRT